MAWYLAEDRDLGNGITPRKFDAARQKALRDEQCASEQRVSVLLGAEDGVIGDADFHNPLGFDRDRLAGGRVAPHARRPIDQHQLPQIDSQRIQVYQSHSGPGTTLAQHHGPDRWPLLVFGPRQDQFVEKGLGQSEWLSYNGAGCQLTEHSVTRFCSSPPVLEDHNHCHRVELAVLQE